MLALMRLAPQLPPELSAQIVPALVEIFRATVSEGRVPSEWCRANVNQFSKKDQRLIRSCSVVCGPWERAQPFLCSLLSTGGGGAAPTLPARLKGL